MWKAMKQSEVMIQMPSQNSKPLAPDAAETARRERHKAAMVEILSCLRAESADLWFELPRAIIGALSETEISLLARATLKALPVEKAAYVFEDVFQGTALAQLMPDIDTGKHDAEDFARHASVPELKSHIRAAVSFLPRSDKERLKRWLK